MDMPHAPAKYHRGRDEGTVAEIEVKFPWNKGRIAHLFGGDQVADNASAEDAKHSTLILKLNVHEPQTDLSPPQRMTQSTPAHNDIKWTTRSGERRNQIEFWRRKLRSALHTFARAIDRSNSIIFARSRVCASSYSPYELDASRELRCS